MRRRFFVILDNTSCEKTNSNKQQQPCVDPPHSERASRQYLPTPWCGDDGTRWRTDAMV